MASQPYFNQNLQPAPSSQIIELPITALARSRGNKRPVVDEKEVDKIVASIRNDRHPPYITVREEQNVDLNGNITYYGIVDGLHRYSAYRKLGYSTLKVELRNFSTETEATIFSYDANRGKKNGIGGDTEICCYLYQEEGLTHKEITARVGIAQPGNLVLLRNNLTPTGLQYFYNDTLGIRPALALIKAPREYQDRILAALAERPRSNNRPLSITERDVTEFIRTNRIPDNNLAVKPQRAKPVMLPLNHQNQTLPSVQSQTVPLAAVTQSSSRGITLPKAPTVTNNSISNVTTPFVNQIPPLPSLSLLELRNELHQSIANLVAITRKGDYIPDIVAKMYLGKFA